MIQKHSTFILNIVLFFLMSLVEEAYTAAMYSMARLNKTGARLMHTHGVVTLLHIYSLYIIYISCMYRCSWSY